MNQKTSETSSQNHVFELRAERVIHRGKQGKTALEARLGRRFSRGFVKDCEVFRLYRNNTYYQVGMVHRHYLGAAQLDLNLVWRQGVPWLGAQDDFQHQWLRRPTRRTFFYRMVVLDAQLSVPFRLGSMPMQYHTVFRGQTTGDVLWGLHQLAIGSRFTVRGFDGEKSLSAERGFYWRNEWRIPLGKQSQHTAYVGIDCGQVYGYGSRFLSGTRLVGGVLGLRGSLPGRWSGASYEVFIGTPLYKPKRFDTAHVTAGFELAFRF